jgi:hypothetical protein
MRAAVLAIAATGATAIAPAAAQAVTATVTGDDGNPVSLGSPVVIRYLNPTVTVTTAPNEFYGFTVTAPNGAQAAPGLSCVTGTDGQNLVNYFGNGGYTVTITPYQPTSDGSFCSSTPAGAPTTLQFAINAGVTVDQVPATALTRKPGSAVTTVVPVHVNVDPGGISNQVLYGHDSQIGADGSLTTTVGQLFPDLHSGQVGVPLSRGPGLYTIVARAEGYNVAGDIFTAWGAPASIRAFAPFDLASVSFPDSHGPSYSVRARMGDAATNGRVSLAIAKGGKGGKYHSLGSVRIRHHAITKRFRLTHAGVYRLRFSYRGNSLVTAGGAIDKVRISRHVSFSSASVEARSSG